ncbi:interferon-induced protein 44-like [Astyanax mexicanus]|uniref:Interferon-induced protein 44-like n=1 Tax=Astyanax mexicanus TaxID=7994 RepID=A0A8B9GU76_ASTMX|nr:interferon-induced protein 44-like [Astyanax mexicanus]
MSNFLDRLRNFFLSHPLTSEHPPAPEPLEEPWRPVDWSNEERQRMLDEMRDFQVSTSKVSNLRILLHGPVGSGKSSFFNSVNTVFQGRNTCDAPANSTAGNSFTLQYKTFKLKKDRDGAFFPFIFSDMKGLEPDDTKTVQTEDIVNILKGHVQEGYTFTSEKAIIEDDKYYTKSEDVKPDDKVHCLVSVVRGDIAKENINHDREDINQMIKVREKARDLGIPQVTLMTMVDRACPLVSKDLKMVYRSRKIKEKMEEYSNLLGVPMHCIFPVKNYSEEISTNINVDILVLTALNNIVHFANDYVERKYE